MVIARSDSIRILPRRVRRFLQLNQDDVHWLHVALVVIPDEPKTAIVAACRARLRAFHANRTRRPVDNIHPNAVEHAQDGRQSGFPVVYEKLVVSAAAYHQHHCVVRLLLGELHARSLVALEQPRQRPTTQKPNRVPHEPEPKLDQPAPGTFQSLLKDLTREGVSAGFVASLRAIFPEGGEHERTIRVDRPGFWIGERHYTPVKDLLRMIPYAGG